jgi:hypothetical protein
MAVFPRGFRAESDQVDNAAGQATCFYPKPNTKTRAHLLGQGERRAE